jgi:hypothetical protein
MQALGRRRLLFLLLLLILWVRRLNGGRRGVVVPMMVGNHTTRVRVPAVRVKVGERGPMEDGQKPVGRQQEGGPKPHPGVCRPHFQHGMRYTALQGHGATPA